MIICKIGPEFMNHQFEPAPDGNCKVCSYPQSDPVHEQLPLHFNPARVLKEKCPECGAYLRHAYDCSKLTLQQARVMLVEGAKASNSNMVNAEHERLRLIKQVTFWQGKFHAVRHENNKLRKENERSSHLQPVMDEMFHDFKQLRNALGTDGSDLPQLLAAIEKLKLLAQMNHPQ